MKPIATLIPAAGASTRYGGCKQLAEDAEGRSLLQRAVDLAGSVTPGNVFVVTGEAHPQIAAALRGATLIHHPAWREGLGSSIACGIERIAHRYRGVMILLADQVALTRQDLDTLCEGFDGGNILCAGYGGTRGVPALFCPESFPLLARLTGERGAKSLLYETRFRITAVPMENAAVDIDSPEDLQRWLSPDPAAS